MKPYPIFLAILTAIVGYLAMYQFTKTTVWTVDIETEIGGNVKWYIDTGSGFSELQGGYAGVPGQQRSQVEVGLPAGTLNAIRLDPIESNSPVLLGKVRWNEPWPGSSGELDLEEASWSNFGSMGRHRDGRLHLEPVKDAVPDIFGVWDEVPTHSSLWWTLVRLSGSLVFGLIAFLSGWWWNVRILKSMEREGIGEENAPLLR